MEQAQKYDLDPKKMEKLPILNLKSPSHKITEKEEKYLRELVEYEFMNIEEPGLMQKFTYGNTKNKMTFTFFHGGKYRVPRFIAKHLESKSTPIWKWRPDGSGSLIKELTGRNPRFQMREVFE